MLRKESLDLEERIELARRLARLTGNLTINPDPDEYISIELASTGGNRVVMRVNKIEDRVSFHIRSQELLEELTSAGIRHEPRPREPKPWDVDAHWIWELSIKNLEQHQEMFTTIVRESVKIVADRRTRKTQ